MYFSAPEFINLLYCREILYNLPNTNNASKRTPKQQKLFTMCTSHKIYHDVVKLIFDVILNFKGLMGLNGPFFYTGLFVNLKPAN